MKAKVKIWNTKEWKQRPAQRFTKNGGRQKEAKKASLITEDFNSILNAD